MVPVVRWTEAEPRAFKSALRKKEQLSQRENNSSSVVVNQVQKDAGLLETPAEILLKQSWHCAKGRERTRTQISQVGSDATPRPSPAA